MPSYCLLIDDGIMGKIKEKTEKVYVRHILSVQIMVALILFLRNLSITLKQIHNCRFFIKKLIRKPKYIRPLFRLKPIPISVSSKSNFVKRKNVKQRLSE